MDRREYLFSKCSLAKLSIIYALPHPKIYTKYGPSLKTPNEKTFEQFRDSENRNRWSKNLKKHHLLWLIWNWKCEKWLHVLPSSSRTLRISKYWSFCNPITKTPITPHQQTYFKWLCLLFHFAVAYKPKYILHPIHKKYRPLNTKFVLT